MKSTQRSYKMMTDPECYEVDAAFIQNDNRPMNVIIAFPRCDYWSIQRLGTFKRKA